MMTDLYHQIVHNMRHLMAQILDHRLDLDEFLAMVAGMAKQLDPEDIEARVYEVDFVENYLFLRTCTQVNACALDARERTFTILPQTITGDATIENRVIVGSRQEGYRQSRFVEGHEVRAAFPIEFYDADQPEGRTKYVLVVDKSTPEPIPTPVIEALKDYAILAGFAISIKELRDRLSRYYEENRNLVLTGRHSASIGHDIRSLNIGVGGYLTLALRLLDQTAEPSMDKVRKYVSLALDNSGQVEALLGNFSQFNRREMILNRDTDLLEAVTEKVASLAHRMDFGRLVEFKLDLPQEKTGLLVDRDWFGTVIENLVRNSIEACRGRTKIHLTLTDSPDLVVVTFEDNCGGIPSDILPDIFTPFRSSKKKGQGLGLANARRVVLDHGGTMRVGNRPGEGVTFILEFSRFQG